MADDDKSHPAIAVAIGGGLAFVAYKAWEWWHRDEDGPAAGWGLGFGTGDGWVNLNPFDKGKAGTGGGANLDPNKWERRTIVGVKGWRRKGVPLPKETGGPATYQAAVLIVGNGSDIPDLSSWPKTLPVFFVHDSSQPLAPLFNKIDGGWGTDARYGETDTAMLISATETHYFDVAATTSKELTKLIKQELDNSLSIQWI